MRVLDAGVDTWSPCWYVPDGTAAARGFGALATVKAQRSFLLPDPVAGHRVGWFPGSGLAFAEGHPAEILAGVDGLCPPVGLPSALEGLERQLWDLGLPVEPRRGRSKMRGQYALQREVSHRDGFAGVRRVDSTLDVEVDTGPEGVAILAGVAALLRASAGGQAQVIFQPGGGGAVETVYWRGHSGKRVLGRWYDKGVESGAAARGRLIRPEDQRRFPKDSRRCAAEFTTDYVRSQFQRRFEPLWRASEGITVGSVDRLTEQLRERLEHGAISYAEAERLGGSMLLSRIPVDELAPEVRQSRATGFRRRARLRELGLILADGVFDEVEVDLHDVLDEILGTDAWGRRG